MTVRWAVVLALVAALTGCATTVDQASFKERLKRGHQAYDSDQLDDAMREFQAAISLEPNRPEGWASRGWVQVAKRQMNDAMLSFERSLSFDAHHAPALRGRARVLAYRGEHAAALPDLEAASRIDQRESVLAGLIHYRLRRFADSERALRKAARTGLEGGTVSLWLYLAQIRAGGEREKARVELAAHRQLLSGDGWQLPVIDYFIGEVSRESLLAGVPGAGPMYRCPPRFFLIQWHVALREWAEVRALLPFERGCASTGSVEDAIMSADLDDMPAR